MAKPWLLVSPASRGIGLQLARRLLKTTDLPVIATARNNVETTTEQILLDLNVNEQRLEVLKLDVTGEFLQMIPIDIELPVDVVHQMKAPSQKQHLAANLAFHPATFALLSASLAFFIPKSPLRKLTMKKPSRHSKSMRSVRFSSQSTSRPFCPAAPPPSNPSLIFLLPPFWQ